MGRQIDWASSTSLILNPTLMLIFALSCTLRLTYAVPSFLGRGLMNVMSFLFLGKNREHISVCGKMIFFGKENFRYCKGTCA